MKLFLLRRHVDEAGIYDCSDGFVIRATNKTRARLLASRKAGEEGGDVWLTDKGSSCELLEANGHEGTVLQDFKGG